MAPSLTSLLVLASCTATSVTAFAPASSTFGVTSAVQRRHEQAPTLVKESFGFEYAEDMAKNTPEVLLGEANYKQWVNRVDENAFLNRQYNVIRRIRELDLLKKTADYKILSKLEKNGIDLAYVESILPTVEEFGLLSLAGNNQQLLINLVAPLVIEGAPILLPLVAGALEVGPAAFYLAAAASLGAEGYLIVNNAEVPLVGLPAAPVAGLLLVPLAVISAGVGTVLANAKKSARI